ncbi:MAG: ferrochelatase [Proteobacteria bacterium]|nr:ferrochelatase [Pseudomonadota bacterium]
MTNYSGEQDFVHGKPEKIGVLLCNLGTPDAPTAKAVRRYLGEFLSDPRVVELPRFLWLAILHGIILRVRPRRSAVSYGEVWTNEGSPLMAISKRQREAVASALEEALPGRTEVVLAMRYGSPSVRSGLRKLRDLNARKIIVLPLYPQYASATTGSVLDAVTRELATWRWVPSLRFINDYFAETRYLEALAHSVREHWATHGEGEHLLMSFHGTPKDSLKAGDPYHCQCLATGRALSERLALASDRWSLGFQSRFGWNEWLQPYTEATLRELAQSGVRKVDVICPGFSADCLETLEEIAMRYSAAFVAAGGESLRYIPALNDRKEHVEALTDLVLKNLAGWSLADPTWNSELDEQDRRTSAARAAMLIEKI